MVEDCAGRPGEYLSRRTKPGLLSLGVSGQVKHVSDTQAPQEKARRWSAFVCPDCRFVFRVPRDHDGEGIVCSSCRRMLKIPGEGDETAPLMAALQKIGFSEDSVSSPEAKSRGKRRRKEGMAELPEWDASAGSWRSAGARDWRSALPVLAWGGGMLAIAAAVVGFVKFTDDVPESPMPDAVFKQDQFDDLVASPLIIPEDELEAEVELPEVMKKSEASFLARAEPLARKFLEAGTVAEILPLIHEPDRVRPFLRTRYPDGAFEPAGMSKFNASGQVSYKDTFAAVTVLNPEYESKQLAFIEGDDGLKIDWESWVGWSDMPWDKILETKPKRPILVRVMVRWVDYYNFGFSDENAWRSYRLVSPDGEHTLYGYVERNSLLDQRLRPGEPKATVAVTIKIRFRENEQAANQVVIDEMVSDGWVVSPDAE